MSNFRERDLKPCLKAYRICLRIVKPESLNSPCCAESAYAILSLPIRKIVYREKRENETNVPPELGAVAQ